MNPTDTKYAVMSLKDWEDFVTHRRKQRERLIELLDAETAPVVEIAVQLYKDGWHGDVDSLVHTAKVLGGDHAE